jgi:hypothetical protein
MAIDRAFPPRNGQETKGKGYIDGSSGTPRVRLIHAMVTFA